MHIPSRGTRIFSVAFSIAGALTCSQADATGLHLRGESVASLGRANAGSAVATDDASVVGSNPAAMRNLTGTTVQADLVVSHRTESFRGGATTEFGGTDPVTGGDGGSYDTAKRLPAIAVVHRLTGSFDKFTLGASLSAPFGFRTEYDADWVGRYHAIDSELETLDLTVSAAWAPTLRLSFGAGLIKQHAEMKLSNAIDFGSFICGIADRRFCDPSFGSWTPQGQDGGVEVRAHDNSLGWVAGAQWRPIDQLSIGLSHRSRIEHQLRGLADFTLPANVTRWFDSLRPEVVDDPQVVMDLTTPSVTTLSVRWDISDRYRLMANIQKTGWSEVRPFRFSSTQPLGILNLDVDRFLGSTEAVGWRDTKHYALGGEWQLQARLTLRAGIATDQTPTNDQTRTARLPDDTATMYSLGLSWRATDELRVDVAYQRIDIDSAKVETPLISPYWFSRLSGNFNGHANLFGIAAQYRF